MEMTVSEIPANIQNITPTCRTNRGEFGALDEALRRIRAAYGDCVHAPDNQNVTWRVSLVRVEQQP
jgi:hypothetical protein